MLCSPARRPSKPPTDPSDRALPPPGPGPALRCRSHGPPRGAVPLIRPAVLADEMGASAAAGSFNSKGVQVEDVGPGHGSSDFLEQPRRPDA